MSDMDGKKMDEDKKKEDRRAPEQNNRRPWVLVAAWFGTIALVGLLKRVLERQGRF